VTKGHQIEPAFTGAPPSVVMVPLELSNEKKDSNPDTGGFHPPITFLVEKDSFSPTDGIAHGFISHAFRLIRAPPGLLLDYSTPLIGR
jgi:hypothetical protein